MKTFQSVRSTITPLHLSNVDTDMIIPAEFLTSINREGFGKNLFRRLRDENSSFPLNNPLYTGSRILLADENFGCGSSREHAVWALLGYGYEVVIAKSFADIFSSNSGKNGLLLVQLPAQDVEELFALCERDLQEITVDLSHQFIELSPERRIPFDYDPFRKHCLLNGLDDLEYILAEREIIQRFFVERPL